MCYNKAYKYRVIKRNSINKGRYSNYDSEKSNAGKRIYKLT